MTVARGAAGPAARSEVAWLDELFDELFPICRSITGEGLRRSLEIMARRLPLDMESVESGTRVFDWTVPPEWRIRAARLTGPDGRIVADLERNNLSVVGYSVPVDTRLSLEDLRPHLHSLPASPEAVPYVTSYYEPRWGFCLPDTVLRSLPEGEYHALIDSEHVAGRLDFAQTVLPGDSPREILLSSYLCHPSMANNELSGPLVLALLHRRLAAWPRRRCTYRFVLAPETIGSLCFLYRHGEHLRRHLAGGLVLTCLGGPSPRLSYKTTRRESTLLDETVRHLAALGEPSVHIRAFDPCSGSDERQYGSPGFNLPVGQMARTVYGTYPGYHNSLDDKAFMDVPTLVDSADDIEAILRSFEVAGRFRNLRPHGEVQFGRRGLYPTMNAPTNRDHSTDTVVDGRTFLERLLTVMNYSDGEHTMLAIARRLGCAPADLAAVIERLEDEDLLAAKEAGDRA